jgi:hypothetical protein
MGRTMARWCGAAVAAVGMALGMPGVAQGQESQHRPARKMAQKAEQKPAHQPAHKSSQKYSQKPSLTYVVSPGESLSDIGLWLLGGPNAWRRLQEWNALVNPHLLHPGQRLVVPLAAMPEPVSLSKVLQVQGSPRSARALRAASAAGGLCGDGAQRAGAATVLHVGEHVAEGSCIDTGERESLTIELPDGSRLQIFPGTRMQLVRTRRWGQDRRRWVELRLEHGRAEAQAPSAPGLLRIGTPLGTAAVRGTTFGVEAQADRVRVDVTEGVVDVRPAFARERAPVQAGQGAILAPGQEVRVAALLPPPVAPPEQGETLVLRDSRSAPVLLFGAVPAAAGYRYVVTPHATSARGMDLGDAAQPEVPLRFLQEGSYTVQLRAVGGDGFAGQAAQRRVRLLEVPDPPAPRLPPDGAVVPYGSLALRCSPATAGRIAEQFEFELARDPGFSHRLELQRREHCALDIAAPGGTLYWRVRGVAAPHGGIARSGAYSQASVVHVETEVSAPLPTVLPGQAVDDAPVPGSR